MHAVTRRLNSFTFEKKKYKFCMVHFSCVALHTNGQKKMSVFKIAVERLKDGNLFWSVCS